MQYSNAILTALAALLAVLGLFLLVAKLLRGSGLAAFRPSQRLVLRDSLVLDRQRSIRIVRCDGRDLLLLIGGSADTVIGWLDGPEEPR